MPAYSSGQYGGGYQQNVGSAVVYLDEAGTGARARSGAATATLLTPPANDMVVNAITITGSSGSVTWTNYLATLETGEAAKTGTELTGAQAFAGNTIYGVDSVWYKWTAPSSEYYYFDTFGTELVNGNSHPDTVLAIFSNGTTIAGINLLWFNDDCLDWPHFVRQGLHQVSPGTDVLSFLPFEAVSGTTYLIRVATYNDASAGPGILNWGIVDNTVLAADATVYAIGPSRLVTSSAVSMSLATSMTSTIVTSQSSGGVTLTLDTTLDSSIDTVVVARYPTEAQMVLTLATDMTVGLGTVSATATLSPTFTLTHRPTDNTVVMRPVFTLTPNASVYAPTSTGGTADTSTTQPLDDSVDVPFETTTGVRISTSATLTYVHPQDTVDNDIRALTYISPVMREPVIIQGRPLHPDFPIVVPSKLAAAVYAAPKPSPLDAPTTGRNEGNKSTKYRWVSGGFPFPHGVYGDHWPAVGTGPAWTSKYPYRPRAEAFEGKVDYGDVVLFWWHYVEHMMADLNIPQPYMFQIVGILHGGSNDQHHHMLDQTNRDLAHIPNIDTPGGQTSTFSEGSFRALMHFRPTQVQQAAPTIYTGTHQIMHKPAIYSGVFNGAKSYIDIDTKGYRRRVRGNAGTNGLNNALLGRQNGHISPYNASHMSVLEINVYNFVPTDPQLNEINKHLYAVYRLDKW